MKRCLFLAALLLLPACGGRKMNDTLARNLIIGMSNSGAMEKSDVEIVNIRQISGGEAVAETRARVAFRFENNGKTWRVREMRIGNGQWESVENIERALNQVKTEETKELLARIAEAIQKYRKANRRLPIFKDFVDLSDQLSPMFITPLVRLDSWQRPFKAALSGGAILLSSAGPDGVMGNHDDIQFLIPNS